MTTRTFRLLAALLVLAALAHASLFAFLCDDAYISFRYARNLTEGHGLVFNVGERVEGYTNFLWTLQLAGLWAWTGIGPETTAIPLGFGSALVALAALAALASTSPWGGRPAVLLALLFAAVHRSIAVWTTSGLEQRQVTALELVAIGLVWRGASRRDRVTLAVASGVMGLALLSRPEPLLLAPCAAAWLLWEGRTRGRPVWDGLLDALAVGIPALVVALGQLAFRLEYYGVPLPNTYYAKGRDLWISGGLAYFAQAALEHGWWLLVPLAVFGALQRLHRNDGLHVLSLVVVAPRLLYLLKNGGDHFEYRALDLVFFLLIPAAVDGLLALRALFGPAAALVTACTVLAYTNVVPVLHYSQTRELDPDTTHLAYSDPLSFRAIPLVLLPGAHSIVLHWDLLRNWSAAHFIAARQVEHAAFCRTQLAKYGGYTRVDRATFPKGLVSWRGSMGVVPFVTPDVTWIDELGLTDATVARMPIDPGITRRSAHAARQRKVLDAYLRTRRNVYVGRAGRTASEALDEGRMVVGLADDVWMAVTVYGRPRDRFPDQPIFSTRPQSDPTIQLLLDGRIWHGTSAVAEEPFALAEGEALGVWLGGRNSDRAVVIQGDTRIEVDNPDDRRTFRLVRLPGTGRTTLQALDGRPVSGLRLRDGGPGPG
ncbi:MAG: hypothetical protein H6736_02170 [Alphaproteobacteria bacterium]|nr:hypothetical protein [Alphaproteobacteria bacterium]